jgi:hypothetical protein
MELKDYLDEQNKKNNDDLFYITNPEVEKIWEVKAEKQNHIEAVYSGIGDQSDCQAVISEKEIKEPFRYQVRLKGEINEKITVYPEIEFEYEVQYEGEEMDDYTEAKHQVQVDAYPSYKLDFDIEQNAEIPIDLTYDAELNMYSEAPKHSIDYVLDYKILTPKSQDLDIGIFFDSQSDKNEEDKMSAFVGHTEGKNLDLWEYDSSKNVLEDKSNKGFFSGSIIKKDENSTNFYSKKDYKVRFTYMPIKNKQQVITDRNGTQHVLNDTKDDDLVGFIFKAQPGTDYQTFYLLLIEADNRVYYVNETDKARQLGAISSRFSTAIGNSNFNISNQGLSFAKHTVKPPSEPGTPAWNDFVNNQGWGKTHKRMFKVENNILKELTGTNYKAKNNKTNGWQMDTLQSITVQSMGKKIRIFENNDDLPCFEFDTEFEAGSFGVCNISQAVQFTNISFIEYEEHADRYPNKGAFTYDDIGEKAIFNGQSAKEIIKPAASKLANGKAYLVKEINPVIVKGNGTVKVTGLDDPIKANAFNGPGAGQKSQKKIKKTIKKIILPSQRKKEDVKVPDYLNLVFKKEIDDFIKTTPSNQAISFFYSILNIKANNVPDSLKGKIFYELEDSKITFWSPEFKKQKTTIVFKTTLAAYEGWKEIANLKGFKKFDFADYKVIFKNKKFESLKDIEWKWASGKKGFTTDVKNDKLYALTKEIYKGIYEGENFGLITSTSKKAIRMPKKYKHIKTGELLYVEHEFGRTVKYEKPESYYFEMDLIVPSGIEEETLNKYFQGGSLKNTGSHYVKMENEIPNLAGKKINALFLAACAMYITQNNGTVSQEDAFNAFNLKLNENDQEYRPFQSFKESIEYMAKNIYEKY